MHSVLIIGLGKIGYEYDLDKENLVFTHTRAILRHDNFELLAGIDIDLQKRDEFSRGLELPAFESISDFLTSGIKLPDVCVIATNTDSHFYYWKETSKLNVKLILIEKPIFSSSLQIEDFVTQVRHRNEKIVINLIRLYQPTLNLILNELSGFKSINVIARVSGGLLHNGIHFLTLFERYFGKVKSSKQATLGQSIHYDFLYEKANVNLSIVDSKIENNSFYIEYEKGVFYYLDGGRRMFTIYNDHDVREYDCSELLSYQYYVYEAISRVLSGNTDDSLELAISSQLQLNKIGGRLIE